MSYACMCLVVKRVFWWRNCIGKCSLNGRPYSRKSPYYDEENLLNCQLLLIGPHFFYLFSLFLFFYFLSFSIHCTHLSSIMHTRMVIGQSQRGMSPIPFYSIIPPSYYFYVIFLIYIVYSLSPLFLFLKESLFFL